MKTSEFMSPSVQTWKRFKPRTVALVENTRNRTSIKRFTHFNFSSFPVHLGEHSEYVLFCLNAPQLFSDLIQSCSQTQRAPSARDKTRQIWNSGNNPVLKVLTKPQHRVSCSTFTLDSGLLKRSTEQRVERGLIV